MNPTYVLLVVVLFVTVALGLEGLHQIWASKHSAGAKRLAARLQAIETGSVAATSSLERDRTRGRWSWKCSAPMSRTAPRRRRARRMRLAGSAARFQSKTSVTACAS